MKYTYILFLTTCCFIACNSAEKAENKGIAKYQIDKRLAAQAPKSEEFEVSSKGGIFTSKDGSKILVPEGAFVNNKGESVNAKLHFTTYRGSREIIASGIPMQANNQGETGQFISDGMFQIQASDGANVLQPVSGKSIEVYQPSSDADKSFQLWFFNETKGQWESIAQRDTLATAENIGEKAESMNLRDGNSNSNSNKIAVPVAYNPQKMVLDLEFDAIEYPELTDYNSIMWQFAGSNPSQDPEKNKWVFDQEWTNTKLKKSSGTNFNYDLEIQTAGGTFTTVVTPALSGNDLKNARAKFQKMISKVEARRKNKEEVAAAEKESEKLYNKFSVTKMGIYNCDRFYGDPSAKDFIPQAMLEHKPLGQNQSLYVVTEKKKNVMQYTNLQNMKIKPAIIDGIITVTASGVLAKASAESIKEMRQSKGGKIKLIFQKISGNLDSELGKL
ncbi:MAG: hypothetical protein KG003_11395 [Bacteroidetes bacterium]|nr:hypothetical protein [Bacteroidota bacterium]